MRKEKVSYGGLDFYHNKFIQSLFLGRFIPKNYLNLWINIDRVLSLLKISSYKNLELREQIFYEYKTLECPVRNKLYYFTLKVLCDTYSKPIIEARVKNLIEDEEIKKKMLKILTYIKPTP